MSWTQSDTSFKKLNNKRVTTSTGKGLAEEKGASTLELYLPDIKTELIPGTPPGASTSVLAYTGSIGQTLAVDTSVPGNLTWFATTGYGNTTVANDGSAGSEANRLMGWVSDKYDAFGTVSGNGYEIKVYDKDSNLITKADPSDWLFDYQTGILAFNNASTAYGTVTSTGPFRIVGYRYIGNKGIISASYGGLGYTSYSKGDLLVGAGSTFIKLNVGSNDYVLVADSSTSSGLRWSVNSGSGTGISVLNGLAASTQFFAVGTAGTVFNISSVGSTHTFNIPIAGTGITGLITGIAQTIAGQKTFTSAILGDLTGTATTSTYAYQSGYAITSGLATTASYAYQSGYAITSGLATTSNYAYQSGYAITSGFATTASYAYQSGYAITSGLATTATYAYQSGYGITSGLATTATYALQSGYAITTGFATTSNNINVVNSSSNTSHPMLFTPSSGTLSGAAVSSNSTISYNPSSFVLSTPGLAVTSSTASTTFNTGALIVTGGVGIGGSVNINGDLTVNGTTTTINSVTLTVDDKNIELGSVSSPSDSTAEAGGITLKGSTDKFINWYSGTGWSSNQDWNLASGLVYKINNTSVLSATSLGTGVTNSSLTALGTITTGVWAGTAITVRYGGTGYTNYTKGDILVGAGSTFIIFPVGTDNYVLSASSSSGSGLTWKTSSAGTATTSIAPASANAGDLWYNSTDGSLNVYYNDGDTSQWVEVTSSFTGTVSTGSTYSIPYYNATGTAITGSSNFTNVGTGISVLYTANTISPTTGALVVLGGVGIGGSINIGSNLFVGNNISLTGSVISGSWAGSAITGLYGGTGYSTYTKGDLLVGAGSTFIKLNVGTDNYVLTASSISATGLTWSPTSATGITSLNGLSSSIQYFSIGYSGTTPAFSSSGSTHTLNIPIAGTGATGLITTLAQTIAGQKTFTSAIIADLTGTATTATYAYQAGYGLTSGFATTASYSYQSGYGITAGLATTATYALQSGYAITSGSSATATTATYSHQSGYGITAGFATTSSYSYQSGYAITSGLATTATYALQSGYAITSGLATTATYAYQSGYGLTAGLATTATYAHQSGFATTAGLATTATYAHQSGYAITSGSSATATTATYALQSGYAITSGFATTATNINVVLAATNASHRVLFTPTSGSASGVAVSTENSFVYNPSTDILSVSGLAVTATTSSTNSSTGALTVTGGMGIGGTVYTATDLNVGNSTTGRLYFSQATLGSAGTTVIPSMAFIGTTNSPITLSVLADNSLSFDGSSGQLFSINNNLSSGWIFAVNDISGLPLLRANADGTVAMGEFAGNIGVGLSNPSYKLHVAGDTNLSSGYVYRINGTSVLSATSLGTGVTNSSLTALGTITTGTWNGSTITGLYGGTGHTNYTAGDLLVGAGGTFIKLNAGSTNYVLTSNGSGTIPSWQTIPPSAASSVAVLPTSVNSIFSITAVSSPSGSGLGLSTISTFVINPSTGLVSMSGLAVTAGTAATNFSTGALVVTGGVGIGGSLFVNGDLTINGTTTTINSVTLTVDDKNIELGSVSSPSDITAEGGGITLKGTTDKFINWYTGTGWSSSESLSLASGNTYKINNTSVLSASSLGTGVTNSSLTAVGTISTGIWAATAITALYGGTGLVPTFTVGDILYANTANTWGRLAASSNSGYILASSGSGATPTYIAPSTLSVGFATTSNYAYQSGYAITSGSATSAGLATTATYAHQSGYAITSGSSATATTATYAHQSGYAITSGLATTASNINVANASTGTFYPVLSNTASSTSGVGASVNSLFSFNAANGAFGATSINIFTGQSYSIGGNSVLSASSLGTGVTNSSLTALGTITTGTWSGSTISGLYGGTGYTSYSKGDILVGAGNTFIKLNVGTDNFVLTADNTTPSGVKWSSVAGLSITSVNGLTASAQFFSTGTSGTGFNISSSGSTHTFNIPIAGTGATGLVSTLAQSFAGTKTFTGDVIVSSTTGSTAFNTGSLTVYGGLGVSGQLSFNQAALGYTGATNPSIAFIGSTTSAPITLTVLSDNSLLWEGTSGKLFGINNNLSSGWIFNVGDISGLPIIRANADGTIAMAEFAANVGIGLSNPSYKLHVAGDTNLSSSYVYRINGASVLSASSLGTGVTNSSLTAVGTITTGTWAATAITALYGGTGLTPSFTVGDILYANTSSTWGRLTADSNSGYVLTSAGSGATPTYVAPSALSVGFATTAGFATTSSYSYQSGYAITSGSSTTSGSATTATYAHQSGYAITSGFATSSTSASIATTATNINVVSATTSASHPVLFTPATGTASGAALSTESTFVYNPSTDILSVWGLAITSTTASTNAITGALVVTGGVGIGGSLFVGGDLTINGTTTTINSVTLTVDDKNIELGSVSSPSDVTAEGGGITLKGATDKFINWYTGTGWSSSESLNLASGNAYKINNTAVLSASSLGTGVTNSSLTALGTITTGVWTGTTITGLYGGTGYTTYTKGDLLVGAGSTFIKLAVGSDNFVLTASSLSATGLTWSPTAATGITSLNGLSSSIQYFSIGYSGTAPLFSSSGSTHTLNIPIAGTGVTGLITGIAQTIAGQKTFTSAIIGDLTGTATTAGFATTATYAHQSGYAITAGLATTATYSYQSGYGLTSGLATTATYAHESGYAITSGFATTANYAYQSGYGITSGFATTASYSYQSGYAITAGFATTANYAYQSGYGLTSGLATTATYAHQSGYAITSGFATTSANINVVNAVTNSAHPLHFSPVATGSGVAVSSNTAFSFNPSTLLLSTSGLAVTASTVSTSSSTGALVVTGGVGFGGTVYTATDLNVGNSTTGRLYFSQATLGSAGTTVIPSMAFIGSTNSPITLSVLADNSLSFDGSSGQLFSINNNLSTGYIFAVNDISGLPLLRANADGTVTMGEFAGNIGIGLSNPSYKLHVVGDTNLSSSYVYRINGTSVLSASSLGTGVTNSSLTALGTITTGTWAGSTISALYGGTGYTTYTKGDILVGAGNTFIKLAVGTDDYILSASSASAIGVSWIANTGGGGGAGTIYNGSLYAIPYYPAAGTAITGSTSFTNTGTSINIGYSTAAINNSTGAFTVVGGVGIGQSLFTSSSYASSISGVVLNNGIITSGSWAGSTITGFYGGTGYNSYNNGDILVGAGSTFIKVGLGSTNYVLSSSSIFPGGIGWTHVTAVGIGITPPSNEHNADLWWNATDGSLNVYYSDGDTDQWVEIAGGSGIDLSQPVYITSGAASTNTVTGALVVNGGVGVAGTVYASSFSINGVYDQISSTLITSNTNTNQVALSIDASSFRTAKMFVQVTSGSNYHSQEILMVHDDSQVYMTEYAMVNTGAIGSTFDGDISGGNMRFLVTPTNAVTTYKIACSAMRI